MLRFLMHTKDILFSPGTLIVLALSLLTPYFYYIPRTTLAAVLISAVIFMIDWKILKTLWKCNSK
jgi:sodium-independent sulfate anion transporter 11